MKQLDQETCRIILEQTVSAFAKAVSLRDGYTGEHQKHVASLSVAIAKEIGMSEFDIQGLRLAAEIHDLGNLELPSDILNKPTALSESEYELIKTHPQKGYDILKEIEFPWPIAEIILQHHECTDGSGYPQGLKGDDILIEAKIISVANVVISMTTYRPYKFPVPVNEAVSEIRKYRGIKYNASVVDACIKVLNRSPLKFELKMTDSGRFTAIHE